MDYVSQIIVDIELHSVEGIKECFSKGVDPNAIHNGQPLLYELTSEYTRTPRFKECVKAFVDHGLQLEDKVLLSVLLDDADLLQNELKKDKKVISKKYMLRCAYTPLYKASLLHICAEYNHTSCGKLLVENGIDVNEKAGVDEYGFGGQTPIFHTVNQNQNNSSDMMNYLLSMNADVSIAVKGFIWGKGYEWETLIPAVNPISYAMMGLLPQMHRNERTIDSVVRTLLKKQFGIDYSSSNVPNKYLK